MRRRLPGWTLALLGALALAAPPAAAQREALAVGLGAPAAIGGMAAGWFASSAIIDRIGIEGTPRTLIIVGSTALGGAAAAALTARSLHPGEDPPYHESLTGAAAGAIAGFSLGLIANAMGEPSGAGGAILKTFVIAALGTAAGATIITFR